ncbi:MAG: hypothetical protein HQK91_07535 [Nitrospirae bacterium]|nr:hypothetical protein [Nitrospirota bacterium]
MSKMVVIICVKSELESNINNALEGVSSSIYINSYSTLPEVEDNIENINGVNILIIDSAKTGQSTIEFTQKIKKINPKTKIILIIDANAPKVNVIDTMIDGIINGVLLVPFTKKQMEEYINFFL